MAAPIDSYRSLDTSEAFDADRGIDANSPVDVGGGTDHTSLVDGAGNGGAGGSTSGYDGSVDSSIDTSGSGGAVTGGATGAGSGGAGGSDGSGDSSVRADGPSAGGTSGSGGAALAGATGAGGVSATGGVTGTGGSAAPTGGNGSGGATTRTFALTVTIAGLGSGSVASTPPGISCGSGATNCTSPFNDGAVVRLTPTAATGSGFAGWSGACSGLGECTATMDQARSATASFSQTATYLVSGATQGAPVGTAITATSTSPGASCSGGGCRVELGGTATLTAPASASGVIFASWSGGPGCVSSSNVVAITSVTADVTCTATYLPVYMITVTVVGGPPSTSITPTSSTPNAVCAVGSCQVPSGGSMTANAPTLTDWYFNGWTGSLVSATASAVLTGITGNQSLTANYINQRQESCRAQPPQNAVTTSTPMVTTTYTTAGGWTTPTLCPWSCAQDYCLSSSACIAQYEDMLSYTNGTSPVAYGGDDYDPPFPCYGVGQGVTSPSAIAMDRFGLNLVGGFQFASTWGYATQPSTLELNRRDSTGTILASYTTTVDPSFRGGWIFWNTPSTALSANVQYIFTSFLASANTQKVTASVAADSAAGYSGGGSYYSQSASTDMKSWSMWSAVNRDLQFRVQRRNPACP